MADSSNRPSSEQFWRTPLDLDRLKIPHGEVQIIVERCKGCEFCVEYCPRGVLEMSKSFNRKGYHYPDAVKSGSCVDCNLCSMICPEFAIYSESAEAQTVSEVEAETTSEGKDGACEPVKKKVRPKKKATQKKKTSKKTTKKPRSMQ